MKKITTVIIAIVLLSLQLIVPLSADSNILVSAKQAFIDEEVEKYMRVAMPNVSSVGISDIFPVYDSTTGGTTNEAVFII